MQKHHLKTLESSAISLTNMLFTRWSHWLKTFSLGIWCYTWTPCHPNPGPRPEPVPLFPWPLLTPVALLGISATGATTPGLSTVKAGVRAMALEVPAKHQQPFTGGRGVEPHWLRVKPQRTYRGFLIIWISTQVTNICVYKRIYMY